MQRAVPSFPTPLTRLFGIAHPILAGGLMHLADAGYVAAIVNAGCMGFISAKTFPDRQAFRSELQKARALTSGKAFGVNLYHSARGGDAELLAGHAGIALEEGVRLFETSGLPPRALLPQLKEAGARVMHKVASLRHALSAQKLDVDAVAVVGAECGGHPGLELVGSMVQAARAGQVVDRPLAVGGGFGHGSQLAAALAMGADAVLMGTRFLVCEEIGIHRAYKERLVAAGETDTRLIMSSLRNTYRAYDNATARSVETLEREGVSDFERYRPLVAGAAQKHAYETGEWESGILSLGQAVVFADRIKPAADIVAQILAEAREAMARLDSLRGR